MRASDFNLSKELIFNFEEGKNLFHDSRVVIMDANSLGLLRQNMIESIGFEQTCTFLLRFGFETGFADFTHINDQYSFDSEFELLSAGPVIHTWEGVVKAIPGEIDFNRSSGEFYFTGEWHNSFEAEQHLTFHEHGDRPICWMLMGYASGWCTAFMERPMLAIEPKCMGMGHDHCGWEIKPLKEWGPQAVPYTDALQTLYDQVEKRA